MEPRQFTASLLRASREGFAGLAASRLLEGRSAEDDASDDFQDWKAQMARQLQELASAVEADEPAQFAAHLAWAREAFSARDIPTDSLKSGLQNLRKVLQESMPSDAWGELPPYFDAAAERLEAEPDATPDEYAGPHGALVASYVGALRDGNAALATSLVLNAIEDRVTTVEDALEHILLPAMREVGYLWHRGQVSVAEEHFATLTTARVLSQALAQAQAAPTKNLRVVVGAVAGDGHDLGIQVVSAFFELAGWQTFCLGHDIPALDFGQAAQKFDVDVVALGASLPTHRQAVAEAVAAIRQQNSRCKVLVGGSAFAGSDDLWRQAGADGHASGPRQAVATAARLIE